MTSKQAGSRFARTMRHQWNSKETKIGREVRIKMKDWKTNGRQSKRNVNHRQQCVCPNGPQQPTSRRTMCLWPVSIENAKFMEHNRRDKICYNFDNSSTHTTHTIQAKTVVDMPVSWRTWWRTANGMNKLFLRTTSRCVGKAVVKSFDKVSFCREVRIELIRTMKVVRHKWICGSTRRRMLAIDDAKTRMSK